MSIRPFLLASVASFIAGSSVLASDLPSKTSPAAVPAKVAPLSWTGFELAVGGALTGMMSDQSAEGYWIDTNVTTYLNAPHDAAFRGLGTVEARANYQVGNMVIGALASYDHGKVNSKHSASYHDYGSDDGWLTTSLDMDATIAVGGRLGVLATDSTLIYAAGGYSTSKLTAETTYYANECCYDNSGTEVGKVDKRLNGYFVGAGIEQVLGQNITVGLEYRYTKYGNVHVDELDVASSDVEADFDNINLQTLRATIGLKF